MRNEAIRMKERRNWWWVKRDRGMMLTQFPYMVPADARRKTDGQIPEIRNDRV